ncbi:hypothetical protein EVAR_61529_1 [Eumeta japonica]|uniref:Integrase catalytic domain-containing protein n=1 Tax=Eumeta variegata TaxID=151549 RepID=A0A4C1YUL6_EUMVA|nr:hypothetical protein EVAR_61529_1 [Eumeta japonica]
MALKRMIARRGCPTEIWSDNGTNLRGAARELHNIFNENMKTEANLKTIRWRFIPPGAPFMGGAWERLIRSVKNSLNTVLLTKNPTEEVLNTLLAEVEYTVNNRPLTYVTTDPEAPESLTPNHFLLGGSAAAPAPGTFNESDLNSRAQWRVSQQLADMFWSRWLREYLPELQHRREPHGRGEALKIGDVVLIADNTLPRNTWPRGVITAVYPGTDGVTRVADVQTKNGVLRRPTKKIVVIPTGPAVLLKKIRRATIDDGPDILGPVSALNGRATAPGKCVSCELLVLFSVCSVLQHRDPRLRSRAECCVRVRCASSRFAAYRTAPRVPAAPLSSKITTRPGPRAVRSRRTICGCWWRSTSAEHLAATANGQIKLQLPNGGGHLDLLREFEAYRSFPPPLTLGSGIRSRNGSRIHAAEGVQQTVSERSPVRGHVLLTRTRPRI